MSNEEKLQTRIEELQGQLQQSDKLASLGVLSAGIAHEIQNPLNFVINFSQWPMTWWMIWKTCLMSET